MCLHLRRGAQRTRIISHSIFSRLVCSVDALLQTTLDKLSEKSILLIEHLLSMALHATVSEKTTHDHESSESSYQFKSRKGKNSPRNGVKVPVQDPKGRVYFPRNGSRLEIPEYLIVLVCSNTTRRP